MMNSYLSKLVIVLAVACAPIYASECLYLINPDLYLCRQVEDRVEAHGFLQLHGSSVGGLYVKGGLESYCSDMECAGIYGKALLENSIVHQDIRVHGKAIFRGSTIERTTDIRGTLEAYDTDFQDYIQIASTMVELTNCTAAGIYVFPYSDCCDCNDLQIVKLSHGTFIQGDIVFESGRGRILMDRGSQIDGCVFGGFITYPGDGGRN